MLNTLKRRRLLGLAVAVGLALSAGIATVAYASIPDASGVIHACYHVNGAGQIDGSATLRVIDAASSNKDGTACKKDENPLDWNQQGIQGPQGPQGPAGPAVAGHVYVSNPNSHEMLENDNTEIVGLSGLPAGNYLIWSPMIIVGDDPTLNSVCDWYVNGATFPSGDPNGYTFQYDSKDDKFGSAPMFGELTLTASTNTIITKCDTDSDNHPIGSGQMIALQVGDVN